MRKIKEDMMMKKMLALLLAVVTVLSLAACGGKESGGNGSGGDTNEPATKPSNALEQIKAEGVLTVALSPDFSPMEFVDSTKTGQDQYAGFDVLLAKFIAQELGVKLEIQAMSFDACQTAVYTGTVPMSISGYSWTETRAENYELSDYYYAGENETEQVLLIRKGDEAKYTKAEDFNGVDVGAQNASLQQQLVMKQLPDANCVTIGDIGVGVLELRSGNIEALAVAIGNGKQITTNNPDLVQCDWQFEVSEAEEANLILMQKGETELLEAVNAALQKAYDSGLYAQWYEEALEIADRESSIEVTIPDEEMPDAG